MIVVPEQLVGVGGLQGRSCRRRAGSSCGRSLPAPLRSERDWRVGHHSDRWPACIRVTSPKQSSVASASHGWVPVGLPSTAPCRTRRPSDVRIDDASHTPNSTLSRREQVGGFVKDNRQEEGEWSQISQPLPRSSASRSSLPFAQQLTCTIDEACEATGLGRTKLYELISAGQLLTTTVGRRRLVLVRSLLLFFEANMPK